MCRGENRKKETCKMAEIKPLSENDNRVRLAEAVPLDYPYAMYVYPTNRCNFRCNYCLHSLDRSTLTEKYGIDSSDLTLETFANAVAGLREDGRKLKTIIFAGQGEPLLNRELVEMIAHARGSGIAERAEVVTNASLLTRAVSDKLISAGLDILKISVQGLTSEKYREVCGAKIDFNEFIGNIRYYYEHKGNLQLQIKIANAGIDGVEDENRFYELFGDISDRMHIEKINPVYDGVEYGERPDTVAVSRYGDTHSRRKVCPPCFFQITLFTDGSVCHCETIYKPQNLGNVNERGMLDMWRGEEIKRFWRGMLKYGKDHYSKCKACCAPDDCSRPQDTLDGDAEEILRRLEGGGRIC
jgi:MoaA/NifB/PqqE/SkfB family radical SAM enzyme